MVWTPQVLGQEYFRSLGDWTGVQTDLVGDCKVLDIMYKSVPMKQDAKSDKVLISIAASNKVLISELALWNTIHKPFIVPRTRSSGQLTFSIYFSNIPCGIRTLQSPTDSNWNGLTGVHRNSCYIPVRVRSSHIPVTVQLIRFYSESGHISVTFLLHFCQTPIIFLLNFCYIPVELQSHSGLF